MEWSLKAGDGLSERRFSYQKQCLPQSGEHSHGLWTIQFRRRALSVRFVVDECVDMGYRLGSCWGLLALLLLALTALEVGRLSAGPTPPSGGER